MVWELDYKEIWMLKTWYFGTVVLEKTLEGPFDCKEIRSVYPKGNQSQIFIGRTDVEAETPKLWPPDVKNWLIGKDSDAGRDWGQEKGMSEDEMAGWHHWLNGHESEWTPGVGDGQGGLACCDSWGNKESDMSERLNWTELIHIHIYIYNGILLSHKKNKFESVLVRSMNLEPVIQSEANQKERNKYHILMHIWPLEKWYWWIYFQERNGDADVENGLVGTREDGESGMNGNSSINMYIHYYVWDG